MNLVAVMDRAYPGLYGGAQLTVWTLLKKLHGEYGFSCELLTRYPRNARRTEAGVALSTYRDVDELGLMLKTRRPQVVVTALESISEGIGIAARFDIPTIAYFQSYEYCPPTRTEKQRWGLHLARQYPSSDEAAYAIHTADLLLVNSIHLQNCFAQKYKLMPRVLYPEISAVAFRAARDPQYITGICGSTYKGIEIFLALADAFPEEKFLLVGDVQPAWVTRVRERQNIRVRGRVEPKHLLRDSKIVVVPSQWAEPFGRIAVEAMGAGIPTLVSYTGGLKEIAGSSPMGIKRFRSAQAWRERVAALAASRELRAEYGERGRALVSKFLQGDSTRQLATWIQELAARRVPDYTKPPLVRLRGSTSSKTAFSMVNAAWQETLANEIQFDDKKTGTPLPPPEIVIDYDLSKKFSQMEPPPSGKWVVVRTWDFGRFPETWVTKINAECDQLWVHSQWVRRQAVASGIDARRVCVVPLGIDPRILKPQGEKYALATRKRFKFIFVGATVFRKGIDILLRAYTQAFTADDDVCLVIKDHTRDIFYRGISYGDEIVRVRDDAHAPSVVYLSRYLPASKMGALYRACDVAVLPYRAEGFAMPILEAMACGVPPIVPRFGACLDFCSDANAFMLPVRRISLPIRGKLEFNTLGFQEELSRVEFGEVPVSALADMMRRAYETSPAELERKRRAGVERAHAHFTWGDSAASVLKQLAALDRIDTPHRLRRARDEALHRHEKLEQARLLYETYLSEKR